jgi:hypothetical protein
MSRQRLVFQVVCLVTILLAFFVETYVFTYQRGWMAGFEEAVKVHREVEGR